MLLYCQWHYSSQLYSQSRDVKNAQTKFQLVVHPINLQISKWHCTYFSTTYETASYRLSESGRWNWISMDSRSMSPCWFNFRSLGPLVFFVTEIALRQISKHCWPHKSFTASAKVQQFYIDKNAIKPSDRLFKFKIPMVKSLRAFRVLVCPVRFIQYHAFQTCTSSTDATKLSGTKNTQCSGLKKKVHGL